MTITVRTIILPLLTLVHCFYNICDQRRIKVVMGPEAIFYVGPPFR